MIATRAALPAAVVQNFKTENVLVDLATEGSLQTEGASVIIGGLQGEQAVLNGRRATVIVKDGSVDPVTGAACLEELETGHVLLRMEHPGGGEEEVSLPRCHLLADLDAELATNAKAVVQAPVADEPFDAEVS